MPLPHFSTMRLNASTFLLCLLLPSTCLGSFLLQSPSCWGQLEPPPCCKKQKVRVLHHGTDAGGGVAGSLTNSGMLERHPSFLNEASGSRRVAHGRPSYATRRLSDWLNQVTLVHSRQYSMVPQLSGAQPSYHILFMTQCTGYASGRTGRSGRSGRTDHTSPKKLKHALFSQHHNNTIANLQAFV